MNAKIRLRIYSVVTVVLLAAVIFFGLGAKGNQPLEIIHISAGRMTGPNLHLVRYDGSEYIVNSAGGIVKHK